MTNTVVGYTGGANPRPTYESCCAGDGHTEAIKVEYDPSKISYDELLNVFFQNTSADSRGKAQYKSAVWVHDEKQRTAAEQSATKRGCEKRLQIMDSEAWHDAEEYHQKYYKKNGCVLQ